MERELGRDPAGVYGRMDIATRDRYLRAVEELARGSGRAETEVARAAVRLAKEAAEGTARTRHVGFYLVDRGRLLLERALGYQPPLARRLDRWVRRHAAFVYLGSLGVATVVAALPPLAWAAYLGLSAPRLVLLGSLLLLPAGIVAASLVNLAVTLALPAHPLPKMGFEQDLPDDCRTLVVVPAILTGEEEVDSLLRKLEIRFLGNAGRNLGFALLTDFGDAADRETPGDAGLLRRAADGVRALDRRYRSQGEAPLFFLLHRERRWNPAEGVWMGWERKRGKLAELNRLLAGDTETSYTAFAGELAAFGPVRYVLTLDADTFLLRGTASRLAAALAHPLNQAELDAGGRTVAGYTVLQPRIAMAPGTLRTRFSRLFAGECGLDLYSRAVSDVYQDLFAMGRYVGKGIYDPVAFERSLAGRVPANTLLSHDLFEGLHGRAGLVSDVMLLEDFPPNFLVFLCRLHRWVRGDWQLLPWLLPRVPAAGGALVRNRLPLIGRWMIFDNLRRSLFGPVLLLLLILGWLWLPHAWVWTLFGAATLALPILLGGFMAGWRIVRGASSALTAVEATRSLRAGVARTLAALALLPYEAVVIVGAVLRSLQRQVTRRHLMEWTTAAHEVRRLGECPGAKAYWRGMASAPAIALALIVLVAALAPAGMTAALPLLLVWGLSPQIAAWLGRSPASLCTALSPGERRRLRLLARRTWHFYERFVGPEDHWLPPDNFQEEPGEIVAHRTSPTSVGMLALSTLTAYDLGFLSVDGLAARLGGLFAALERLERYRGHFWNWYDTRSLAPLEPRYVSRVDSGNLAACLLTVARGCREAARAPEGWMALRKGLVDILGILAELLRETARDAPPGPFEPLAADLERLGRLTEGAAEAEDRGELPGELETRWLPRIEEKVVALQANSPPPAAARVAELFTWTERLRHHLELMRHALRQSGKDAERVAGELEDLAARAEAWVVGMDFGFLFDRHRQLFRIGYNGSTGELDRTYDDLLALEARIASLIAIATGKVPPSHWAHLGRPFARAGSSRTLLSWGGTMFEFLMPRLLLEHPEPSPLAESCHAVVERQIAFAQEHGIPWGISESGYAELDDLRNYRYRAFGIPGLGLKRGLGDRLVVSPYASILALPFAPQAVLENLARLADLGLMGRYGPFEAIDFGTAPADGERRPPRIVRSYMAHHQGMILTALGNALHEDAMVRRFHADPRIATVDFLLHEQAPRWQTPSRSPREDRSKRDRHGVERRDILFRS